MIHREGKATLIISFIIIVLAVLLVKSAVPLIFPYFLFAGILFYIFLLSFFRNPVRTIPNKSDDMIYAPADGKVVVIEKTHEADILKADAIQISIFMSPLNVHVNRHPVSGTITHAEHHVGKFLPAWDPKSSTENERTSIAYQFAHGQLLLRQVAGALAKRIVFYAKKGDKVNQGEELGFIKFGSRVDLYLPPDATVLVKLGEMVEGNITKIAKWQ